MGGNRDDGHPPRDSEGHEDPTRAGGTSPPPGVLLLKVAGAMLDLDNCAREAGFAAFISRDDEAAYIGLQRRGGPGNVNVLLTMDTLFDLADNPRAFASDFVEELGGVLDGMLGGGE